MNGIKKYRKKANLTQQQLARALAVYPSTICMWESGERFPRSEKLPELAKIFGCSIDDLYADDKSSA